MSQPSVSSYSPGGVFVGTEPPAVTAPVTPPPTTLSQQFSADDLARAREQEKSKLYPQLDQLKAEVARLQAERDAQVALEQQHRAAAEAATLAAQEDARRKAESEMDAKTLLETTRQEWEQKFQQLQRERERQDAILVKEQQLRELVTYRESQKAQNVDLIHPTLIGLVDGSTFEEIDASIARLQAASAAMLEEYNEGLRATRSAQQGVRPYGGPTEGPLDTYSDSDLDASDKSMAWYIQNRDKLLAQTRSDRGLFG
jgi:DNA repair exonuclease SbcCD ATPase subunit